MKEEWLGAMEIFHRKVAEVAKGREAWLGERTGFWEDLIL